MDTKTAFDVLKGLSYRLHGSTSEEDQIIAEALNTVLSIDISKKDHEVLYLCDRKKCKTCSYPRCKYTTDLAHAGSFAINEAGMYKEVETKTKRKMIKELLTKGVFKTE